MARNSWVGWWAILFFMGALGGLSLITCFAWVLTPRLPLLTVYLGIGLLMYASDPRYWVMGIEGNTYTKQETKMLFLWPVLYPYYFGCLLLAGWSRIRNE